MAPPHRGVIFDIDGTLTDTTSADDAERSKPDPDIVVAAMRRSGCEAANLVMIGDTPYDVEAARRAGVRIMAVRGGGWSDPELSGAASSHDDVGAIVRDYDASFPHRSSN